ncbi:PorA family porin [Corynebacterium testudinoris]|uniref:Uncharacterized protein n=1 Tax=Corynebacterium testudinoris TaxID=136857 RepID=A0A0G3HAI8_9CORY|nr:PorA family porin [Corynebacterium testudinoris]AKK09760.1 hypothetical protein CTEST_11765 [Corynebacterium testudinoris]MBX8996234.1 PorA family porin [Corynebacterium testudinoris]
MANAAAETTTAAPKPVTESGLFDSWIGLSSGFEFEGEKYPTIVSYVFNFLKNAGDWAGAVNSLIGLVN